MKKRYRKKALITGICGQDGAYLAQFLLKKNYKVYGFYRRSSSDNTWRLKRLKIFDKVELLDVDLLEFNRVKDLILKINPDELYNLAAQSFVGSSFNNPHTTTNINSNALINILEIIRLFRNGIKLYQASTSEMYGNSSKAALSEKSIFLPDSPYAISKLYSHHLVLNYRKAYNLNFYSGILFNHESPLRGEEFVTRKITKGLIEYVNYKKTLFLGNVNSIRDWGYAKEYVEVMWRMMNYGKSSTYVIGTGKTYSVKSFINQCLKRLKIDYIWKGKGLNTTCINKSDGSIIIGVDAKYYRPSDVVYLKANNKKAKKELNWSPKITMKKLSEIMIDSEIEFFKDNN